MVNIFLIHLLKSSAHTMLFRFGNFKVTLLLIVVYISPWLFTTLNLLLGDYMHLQLFLHRLGLAIFETILR